MPKVVIDPIARTEQFKRDLAAMHVGPKQEQGPNVVHLAGRMTSKYFQRSDFAYTRWSADLQEGQTLEHALEPRFWIDQAEKLMGHDKLKPKGVGDIIELRQPSTGLYVELIVTEVGTGFIKVKPIRAFEPPKIEIPDDVPFKTKWNVGAKKHEVLRRADNVLMQGDFQTKEAAVAWITQHMAAMNSG